MIEVCKMYILVILSGEQMMAPGNIILFLDIWILLGLSGHYSLSSSGC